MSDLSQLSLQKAVYEALSGDIALMALAQGVFDRPPQGAAYPHVILGEGICQDWSSKTTDGSEVQFSLSVWSREGGRREAIAIMERLYALLHQADLDVEGQELVMLRFISSQVRLEDDGCTYRGMMQFKALMQSA